MLYNRKRKKNRAIKIVGVGPNEKFVSENNVSEKEKYASNYIMFEKYKIKIQDVPKMLHNNFWEIWYEAEITKKKDAKNEDKL